MSADMLAFKQLLTSEQHGQSCACICLRSALLRTTSLCGKATPPLRAGSISYSELMVLFAAPSLREAKQGEYSQLCHGMEQRDGRALTLLSHSVHGPCT